jgi:hypothetical protein
MAVITPTPVFPVTGAFNTTPPYSGTFIPAVWAGKFNVKFYATSVFADVCNTNWEGEISSMGDKVIINDTPTIVSQKYKVGAGLNYIVPTPNTQELVIDHGRYFAFQSNDVMKYQSQPALIDKFSADAMENLRIDIDSECWYGTFSDTAATNKGSAAGKKSQSYNLGTDAAPVVLTKDNVLALILQMASVLDESNIPNDRWLVIDPQTRTLLMQSGLAQAYMTGDPKSIVRNGVIGQIDRFTVYVTNQLPFAQAVPWLSGNGEESSITSTGGIKRRVIMAGHKAAMTFASQFTKTETVRNPNDFGDYVRSLKVYGFKTVKPDAMTMSVVA